MKMILLLALAGSIGLTSCSQNIPASKIPSVVQNTLQAKFPGASNTEWEKARGFFKAEFEIDSVEYKAEFDGTGKLLRHYSGITETTLPQVVRDTIAKDHPGYKIDDAEKLEVNGAIYFQVELEANGKKDIQLVFSENGSISTVAYLK